MELINKLKQHVILKAANPSFIHHKWFINHHLEIVEKCALKFARNYKNINVELMLTLVWMHDYGKIINIRNQYETTYIEGKKAMITIGFSVTYTDNVMKLLKDLDGKLDLKQHSCRELQIVSTADGVSHLISPFFLLYWYENPTKPIQELMNENMRKVTIDFENKIVLPRIKTKIMKQYNSFQRLVSKQKIDEFIQTL